MRQQDGLNRDALKQSGLTACPIFQGKFQYLAPGGAVAQEGACRLHFDAQTLTLTPENGAALAFDLGDLDAVTAADWEVRLPLYTGRSIVLRQLGKSYDTVAHDLTDAYRNRAVQCMLLEDMGEVSRFTGNFEMSGGGAGTARDSTLQEQSRGAARSGQEFSVAAGGYRRRQARLGRV